MARNNSNRRKAENPNLFVNHSLTIATVCAGWLSAFSLGTRIAIATAAMTFLGRVLPHVRHGDPCMGGQNARNDKIQNSSRSFRESRN